MSKLQGKIAKSLILRDKKNLARVLTDPLDIWERSYEILNSDSYLDHRASDWPNGL